MPSAETPLPGQARYSTFNLGSAAQNNVVSANNQTVVLPGGTYAALQLLAATVFGPKIRFRGGPCHETQTRCG